MSTIIQLQGFANELMEFSDIDGGDLQDLAVEFKLLQPFEVDEPCGENCICAEYGGWPQTCYRKTRLLTEEIPVIDADQCVEFAVEIRNAAVELDYLKNTGNNEQRAAALKQINALHDIAHRLAGARFGEIYDQPDGSELEEETHL
jgi:hypothetical protein